MGCCSNGGYHEFNLDWFIKRFNEIQEEWDGTREWLKNWVDSFDISGEVKKVMQEWVDDGTFEDLINQQIFGDINKKIDQNTSDISALETRVDQAETDIAGNKTAIQSVDTRVKALESRHRNMYNRRFVLIADSYGEFNLFTGFINQIKGVNVESKWTGGAGFTKTGDQSYYNMLNALTSHNDIDYVVVFGFYNDTFDTVNLTTKIAEFVTLCNSKYPGAQIVLVNEGWTSDVSLQGQFQYTFQELNNRWIGNGITVINTWKYLHVYARMADDKIHPVSSDVGETLGALAAKVLMGGNVSFTYPIQQVNPTYINSWQSYGNTPAPYQEMNDEECLLYFVNNINHYGIDKGVLIKCDGNNYQEIFQLPKSGCVIGSGDMVLNIPCILGDTSGKYYQGSVTLEMYDSKLRIRPRLLENGANDYSTITLNSIQWTACVIRSNIYHV